MNVEIEKKFLVYDKNVIDSVKPTYIKQGYVTTTPEKTVRIRIYGDKGFITIKGKQVGSKRIEYEYEIPLDDANVMIKEFCKNIVEKDRYLIKHVNHTWEVDIYYGKNEGLITAEIELSSENEQFILPDWIGEEVTQDFRYSNSNLSINPYNNWEDS